MRLRSAWSKTPPRGGESRREESRPGRAQPESGGLRNGCSARWSSLYLLQCCLRRRHLSSRVEKLGTSGAGALLFEANAGRALEVEALFAYWRYYVAPEIALAGFLSPSLHRTSAQHTGEGLRQGGRGRPSRSGCTTRRSSTTRAASASSRAST